VANADVVQSSALFDDAGPFVPADEKYGIRDYVTILFLTLTAARTQVFGIESGDRYLWMIADLVAVIALLQNTRWLRACFDGNIFLTSWPILAIASTFWSLSPESSFYQGLQLLATIVIGYVIQLHFGLMRVVKLVFCALTLGQVLTIAVVILVPSRAVGAEHEWLGIYPHKNVLGGTMALNALCAACLFMQGWHRLITLPAFVGAFSILVFSRSGTGLVAVAVGMLPLALAMVMMRGRVAIGFALGVALSIGSVLIAVVATHEQGLSAALFDGLGKDRSLTGRTVLWQFAYDQFLREPWIGVGYKAYWESAQTSAEYLRFVIKQKLWFFHNNFFDVAVAFGILGLTLFVLGLLTCLTRSFKTLYQQRTFIAAFPLVFCFYTLTTLNAENVLFQNHSVIQVMLAAIVPLALPVAAAARDDQPAAYDPSEEMI
jgi:exopolysaccharide production protein ExoQ